MTDDSMIHNRAMIVNNLSMLVKNKCMISADLGGKDTLLTAIISINHKDGTLLLDSGSSDFLNKKMISTPRIKFTTGFNGIQVAFTADQITLTKYEGNPAFLTSIPSSLFWFNRRDYYRVNTPLMNPSICEIALEPPKKDSTDEYISAYKTAMSIIEEQLLLKIKKELFEEQQDFIKAYAKMSVENKIKAKLERQQLEAEREINPVVPDPWSLNLIRLDLNDISLSGFSMKNYNPAFSYFLTPELIYENCALIMPGHGEVNVSFEIMMQRPLETQKVGAFAELLGVKFIELKHSVESTVLRYIQDLERQRAALTG
jgi:c-di-GMP-binding flagellar brake protein YcgR